MTHSVKPKTEFDAKENKDVNKWYYIVDCDGQQVGVTYSNENKVFEKCDELNKEEKASVNS